MRYNPSLMTSDVDIAREFSPRPIQEIGESLGLTDSELLPFGRDIGKVHIDTLKRPRAVEAKPKLVLVSAITPTPAGEGKTTTTIGLGQAFTHLGHRVCLALREPSLGPCMGMKGGATGGGHSQLMPAERINLHFTGDFHAITSANNLLSAAIDNHIYWKNDLGFDPRRIVWRRVMDMNDRSLRHLVLGLGGRNQGIPREGGFDITAASEIMAILCLAEDANDLRKRINRILIGYRWNSDPIHAEQLGVTGAMLALMRDALHPNLVQSFEGTPALIHGGPFANIAHGCSSVIATRMAMHLSEWAITEAGFGFDLGAEKFFDIKCRGAHLNVSAVVLVVTLRALKMHGNKPRNELSSPDPAAVGDGLPNLEKHIENVRKFGHEPVITLNCFETDTAEEAAVVERCCERLGVAFAESKHHAEGGKGAVELAQRVIDVANRFESDPKALATIYDLEDSVPEKVRKVAQSIYGARNVAFTKNAEKDLKEVERLGYSSLPICIAKAPSSLSDDPNLSGRPRDFEVTVRNVQINSGAGFLVVLTGTILRMPGLPMDPLANHIDLEANGTITGLE